MKTVAASALSALLLGCMSSHSSVSTMNDGTFSIAGDSRGPGSSLSRAHSNAMDGATAHCGGKRVVTVKFDDAPQFNSFSTVMTFTCGSK